MTALGGLVIPVYGLIPAIVGLVLSVVSRRSHGPTGTATAGLVIGIIACSIWLLIIIGAILGVLITRGQAALT